MSEDQPKKKRFVKFLILFWLAVLGPGIGSVTIIYMASHDHLGALPSFEELENPNSNLATEIYSADGVILGKYFRENRTNINYDELSPNLVNALVSTEDERYYEHSGVDFLGLARAVGYLGTKGGASTITQQLSKMLFTKQPGHSLKRVVQKLKEWVIATRLERQYTKDEIIAMYFNKLDFVNNAVGIKSAANVYFNTNPINLKVEEAAMLVGMAKNPSLFNPIRRPDTTLQRRNVVLFQMRKNGYITTEEFDSLKQIPLVLDYHIVDHKEGLAPYFREILRSEVKKIFTEKDSLGNYKLHKPGDPKAPYDIYKDGLKIYTTLDSRMQLYAENAVTTHLKNELQDDLFRDLKKRHKTKYPFDWKVTVDQVNQILRNAMKQTQRYRILAGKECGNCGRRGQYISQKTTKDGKEIFACSAEDCQFERDYVHPDSIEVIFNRPDTIRVFTWKGEIDTVMSPMDSIRYYKSYLQAGLMSMDPHTGFIKAWVGGIDYHHFKYDHVKQGKRQVGSTFKPFVYALAIDNGLSPCYEVPNVPVVFQKEKWGMDEDWSPKNSDGLYGCNVSLKYGLANSMNTVTAWVLSQYGLEAPKNVIRLARRMGITSHLDPVPSLCLGVADLSLYEMVGANSTFVNKGVWTEPIFISHIEDKNGNVIKDFIPETREAMSEETAYIMLDLMKGVVDGVYNKCLGDKMKEIRDRTGRGSVMYTPGTGMRIRGRKTEARPYVGIPYPMAGKTGTTQNNSDGWFMGLTPDLVTGVWVGAEDRGVRFSRTSLGQGANTALPIYGYYMNSVYEDESLNISKKDFEKPEKPIGVELNCTRFKYSDKNSDFSSGGDVNFGDDDF